MADTELPRDPVIEAVRGDLLRRQQHGYLKYGGTLATNPADLIGKLKHAYEEVLDLANYLKWAQMQLEGDRALAPDPTHNTGLRPIEFHFCASCMDSEVCKQLGFCMYLNGQNA